MNFDNYMVFRDRGARIVNRYLMSYEGETIAVRRHPAVLLKPVSAVAWSMEFFIVTEHRLMLLTGVLNRRLGMIPLAKVTDIALDRSALGRTLGYGEFIMESAGKDQALRNVTYMPYPEQLYLEISSLVFPAVDEHPD
jgi:hypothetical protein